MVVKGGKGDISTLGLLLSKNDVMRFAAGPPLLPAAAAAGSTAGKQGKGDGGGQHCTLPGIPHTEKPRLLALLWELTRPAIRKSS